MNLRCIFGHRWKSKDVQYMTVTRVDALLKERTSDETQFVFVCRNCGDIKTKSVSGFVNRDRLLGGTE